MQCFFDTVCCMVDRKREKKDRSMIDTQIFVKSFDYDDLTSVKLNYLNDEEKTKAKQFVHQKDKQAYQLSHIYLREILSVCYPDVPEKLWCFKTNQFHKPYIALKSYKNVYFNISHTSSHFAMILSNTECGIDIEQDNHKKIEKTMLELVLTKQEQNILKKNDISFYTFWTLKEAHLKALGKGLLEPLHNIEFLDIRYDIAFEQNGYEYITSKIASDLYLSYARSIR